ncbi:ABC transporter substrate-binding protein [Sphingomonas flavalba]|uniref:ABC transporter substrate-binding protein n=1 Tax=Sphingomonas flavalba TaxID=2559804 RepID=UPI0039DFB27A
MRRRSVTGVIAGLAAPALLLGGCAAAAERPAAAGAAPLIVHGATSVVELGPVHLAVETLYPAGSKVAPGGAATLGRAVDPPDVATNAETQILRESIREPDLRIIMTVAEGLYRIVARKSAGITTVADLRGKRIATLTQTSAGYFLSRMLAGAGMSIDDVTIRQIHPLPGMVAALERGEVDAVAIWEPHSENAVRALGGDVVEFSGKGIYRELFNLNSTATVLADPMKRARVVELVGAIIDATAATNRNPTRAQQLVADAAGFTVEEVAASWRHHAFVAAFPDDMLAVLVEEEAWLAGLAGRTPRSREELARLIDRSVYDEAMRLRR